MMRNVLPAGPPTSRSPIQFSEKTLHPMRGESPFGFLLPILAITVSDAESDEKMVFDIHSRQPQVDDDG